MKQFFTFVIFKPKKQLFELKLNFIWLLVSLFEKAEDVIIEFEIYLFLLNSL